MGTCPFPTKTVVIAMVSVSISQLPRNWWQNGMYMLDQYLLLFKRNWKKYPIGKIFNMIPKSLDAFDKCHKR